MPPKSPASKSSKQQVVPPPSESLYPAIEGFIESASADEVKALYEEVRTSLAALKGARAENAKKAAKGVARTEELLSFLLQVREKIEAERKAGGAGRR